MHEVIREGEFYLPLTRKVQFLNLDHINCPTIRPTIQCMFRFNYFSEKVSLIVVIGNG